MSVEIERISNIVKLIRAATKLNQARFACLLGLSLAEVKMLEKKKIGQPLSPRIKHRIYHCCGARISQGPKLFQVCDLHGARYTNESFKQHRSQEQHAAINVPWPWLISAAMKMFKAADTAKCSHITHEEFYWALESIVSRMGLGKYFVNDIKAAAKTGAERAVGLAHFYCCLARLDHMREILPPAPKDISKMVQYWQRLRQDQRRARRLFRRKPGNVPP